MTLCKDLSVLDRCIIYAVKMHAGQTYAGLGGFSDEPSIFHPIRVMMRMESDEERQVAVLHDVLEDTVATPEDLQRGTAVSDRVLDAVVTLRRLKDAESYAEYIGRIDRNSNPLVRPVKIADLIENLSRHPPVSLVTRYRRALEVLWDDAA